MRCTATKRDGTQCKADARHGRQWCFAHDPELQRKRLDLRRRILDCLVTLHAYIEEPKSKSRALDQIEQLEAKTARGEGWPDSTDERD